MKILAVDFGEARTGLAVCDSGERLASPLEAVNEKSIKKAVQAVCDAARAHRAETVVVGLPLNMDGSRGERAERCELVADMLREAMPDVPVEMWDERGTTKTAIRYMNETDTRGKKRKRALDGEAAAIILESYLAYRRNRRAENADRRQLEKRG